MTLFKYFLLRFVIVFLFWKINASELNGTISNDVLVMVNNLKTRNDNNTIYKSDNNSSITNVIKQNNVSNNIDVKIINQREVIQGDNPKPEVNNLEDVRLFLPPDISIILDAMENLRDKMCKEHILRSLEALERKEKWAMQMLDSSTKFPSSILTGSYYQMGNFDECISVQLKGQDHNVPFIKGQYCLADVHSTMNKGRSKIINEINYSQKVSRNEENSTLHWAICIPHTCKPKEVSQILGFVINGAIGSSKAVTVNVTKEMCYYNQNIPYTSLDMIYVYIILSFLFIILIATFYHIVMYYKRKNDKTSYGVLSEVILSFSLINNMKKILSVGKSDLNLNCICGIKFLSMILIISAHSLLFLISGPVSNDEFMKEAIMRTENSIFLNNPLLVDTYLLISGFLLCRLVLLELDKRKGRVNFFILYIARYVRLTPVYFVIIGFYCTWLVRLDQGPLWVSRIGDERDRCLNSWWANLLYINNYVNVDKMCMFQSWYLAVDTQLFMFAPVIVYPLWKWRKIGEFLLGFFIVASILIPSIITYIYKLDPTFMMFVPELRDLFTNVYFINSYIKTHMRANSYFLGLLFGYLVHKLQSSSYKFSRISVALGWIFSGIFMMASIFSVTIFYNPDYEYNALQAAAYSVLHRVVWCLGVGWVMLACITENGGFVDKFLRWKPFIPLSRITYCAYLANGIIELHDFATVRQPRHLSIYNLACDCLAHLGLTFTLAFILCIIFESPINGLEKVMLKRDNKSRQTNQNEHA